MQTAPNSTEGGMSIEEARRNSNSIATWCEQSVVRLLAHLNDYVVVAFFEADGETTTFKEAMSFPEKEKWLQAMFEERVSLDKNLTWDLVELPLVKWAVRCKCVVKKKVPLS